MKFKDKIILVTGSSRGIGRCAAQMFAKEGGRVAVHYNDNRSSAEETLASLSGGPHMVVQADVRDPDAVQNMVAEVVDKMGGLHILVNNAGVFEAHPAHSVGYEDWRSKWNKVLGTNLIGAANVSFCAIQHMVAHGGGRIVNVSSRGAFRGEPDSPAYGASKAGMNAMGQSLAKSLAPHGIFVHTVAPGFVDTDMAGRDLVGERGDAIRAQSPLNRVAKPEEVAHTILFLASEETEFLTGCIVDVNGASYLRT